MEEKKIIRDGFTFYRSFYESVSEYETEKQNILFRSIIEYALTGKEPIIDDRFIKSIFLLIKPNIDSSVKRYDQRKTNNEKRANEKKIRMSEHEPNTSRTSSEIANNNKNNNKNYINNKNDNSIKSNKEELYSRLPVDLRKAMEDYEVMRKQMGKPLTDNARKTILMKLQDYSKGNINDQIEMLNQSIERCWLSVFPLNSNQKKSNVNANINANSNGKGLSVKEILSLRGGN